MARKRRTKGTSPSWGVQASEDIPNLGMPSIMGWMSILEQRYVTEKLKEISKELQKDNLK